MITFVTPTSANKLCGAGNSKNGCIADLDGTAAGWQGTVTVKVTLDGVPVTTGNANISIGGLALVAKPLDAMGTATLTGVTLPEGPSVALFAQTDNIPGRGIGTASLSMLVDTIPPNVAPTALAVVPLDRRASSFTLSWTAPADAGQATVSGYDIHVKKASALGACGTEVTTVPFTTTPKAGGSPESIAVSGLYIETPYCFTVAAIDEAGNVGTTPSMVMGTATFNRTVLQPADLVVGDGFGYWIDASADLVGADGLSDILVGDYNGHKAYLFAGSGTGPSSTPTVTFSSAAPTLYFGGSVAAIGDIDADGKQDVAVTSANDGNGKVYIYKGSSLVSGTTRTEAQADYVITFAANYSNTYMGYPIVRVGDFNGDGVDDFAMGSGTFGSGRGRVVIILGNASFSSFTLDDTTAATKARRILIDGVAASEGFGSSIVSTGAYLMVGAIRAAGSAGTVYSIKNRAAAGGSGIVTFDPSMGDTSLVGTVAGRQFGFGLNSLGGGGLVISNPFFSPTLGRGSVDVRLSGGTTGPLSSASLILGDSLALLASDWFGYAAFGGGLSGSAATFSFIGSDKIASDLVVIPYRENNKASAAYILDGSGLQSLASPSDVVSSANVRFSLPADWFGVSLYSGAIKDVNGDGYGDLALGELDTTLPPSIKGRVLILW